MKNEKFHAPQKRQPIPARNVAVERGLHNTRVEFNFDPIARLKYMQLIKFGASKQIDWLTEPVGA